MARIRSVKPEFWNDRKLSRLSRDARLLYIALWNQSDEHGRLHGDARYIKGHCFPYDDDLGLGDIERLIKELDEAGRIVQYVHDGDPYLYLPNLSKHQRLESAKQESRLPEPPEPPGAGKSADSADLSAQTPDESGEIVAQQVAGSRLQVAGSRGAKPAATPRPAPVSIEGPNTVVAAYVEAAEARTGNRPAKSLVGQVSRDAKRLLSEGFACADLVEAARQMAAQGWHRLDVQLQKPQRGKPVSNGIASQPDEAYLDPGIFSRQGA